MTSPPTPLLKRRGEYVSKQSPSPSHLRRRILEEVFKIYVLSRLRQYYKEYQPQQCLFEGIDKQQYSASSIQAMLKQALAKARIMKKMTVYTTQAKFCHSFAWKGNQLAVHTKYIGPQLQQNHRNIYTHYHQRDGPDKKDLLNDLDNDRRMIW